MTWTPQPNPSAYADARLEQRITAMRDHLLAATDRDTRYACACTLGDLIAQRSPAQVARMEWERGLRR